MAAGEKLVAESGLDAAPYRAGLAIQDASGSSRALHREGERSMKRATISVLLAAVALSGCSSGGGQAGPSSSPATATPSATPPSPTDLAKAQALAMLPSYYRTLDKLYTDPTLPLNGIYTVSVQPDALTELKAVGIDRSHGYRQSGTAKVVRATVASVDLTSDTKAKPHPIFPTVKITACLDVSGVGDTDAAGKSRVPASRPRYQIEELTLLNLSYPQAAGWRVSDRRNRQATSCDG